MSEPGGVVIGGGGGGAGGSVGGGATAASVGSGTDCVGVVGDGVVPGSPTVVPATLKVHPVASVANKHQHRMRGRHCNRRTAQYDRIR
jgi:hypothetical protein